MLLLQYWLPARIASVSGAWLRKEPSAELDCCERLARGAGQDALDHVEGDSFAARWWFLWLVVIPVTLMIVPDLAGLADLIGNTAFGVYNWLLIAMICFGFSMALVLQWRWRAANRIVERNGDLAIPRRKLPKVRDFPIGILLAAGFALLGYACTRR